MFANFYEQNPIFGFEYCSLLVLWRDPFEIKALNVYTVH